MNKKLALVAALVLGAAGLFLSQQTVKAQDTTDNSAMNSDNSAMNADNSSAPAAQ